MPARKAAQGLKGHPMEQKIIEALLSGQSPREIATWVRPTVTHVTVWRYMNTVVKPTMANAETLTAILPEKVLPKEDENEDFERPVTRSNGKKQPSEEVKRLTTRAILAAPALHIRENRLKLQQEMTNRLLRVVNERGEDMSVCEGCRRPESAHPWEEMQTSKDKDGLPIEVRVGCDVYRRVPGGETGLVIRKLKATGIEYAVDTAVLAEIREQEKHIAIELGQWQENVPGSAVSIQIVCPSAQAAAAGELPRVSFAAADQIESAHDSVQAQSGDEIPEISLTGGA